MDSHICIPKKYTDNDKVLPPKGRNVVGYVFNNTGNSIVNIVPYGYDIGFEYDQWTLEPGDWIDTRNIGTYDIASYKLEFQAQQVPVANNTVGSISEITVSIFIQV